MRKFKKLAALLLALAMVFALAACGNDAGNESKAPESEAPASEPAGEGNSEAPAPGGEYEVNEDGMTYVNVTGDIDLSGVDLSGYTFGYVTISSSAPWGGRVGTEFERLAKEAGADVQSLDANTNPDDVTNYCNQMLDAGVDALVVFGGTPDAMVEIAQRCSDEGVALFLTALDVAEAGREYATACIGPDQEKAFTDIANYIIEANGTDEDYTVVQISGVPFLDDYIQREAGFKAGMDAAPNYTLLAADYAYSSRPDAKTFMENHITAEGDAIDIVIGYDDDLTMGAVDAIGDPKGIYNEDFLYRMFGVNAELLIDHAWGWEPCTIADIKAYKPRSNSLGAGQVLQEPYPYEKAKLVVSEMADSLALDLVAKNLVTDQIVMTIGYDVENEGYGGEYSVDRYGRKIPKHAHGTQNLQSRTSSGRVIRSAAMELFERIINKKLNIRRIYITAAKVVPEDDEAETPPEQLDLFTDYAALSERKKQEQEEELKEKKRQQAVLEIRKKYGKNAVLKGVSLEDGATAKNRNEQIGGHKA